MSTDPTSAENARKNCAVIEIVEASGHQPGPGTRGVIKPNSVRINGQPLWCPQGSPITVHEIRTNEPDAPTDEALSVTLTLWARRIYLGHASESPERSDAHLPGGVQAVTCGPNGAVLVRETDDGTPTGKVIREYLVGSGAASFAESLGVAINPVSDDR